MSDPKGVRSAPVSQWGFRGRLALPRLLRAALWGWIYPLSHTWLMPTGFFEQKGAPLYMAGLFAAGAVMALAPVLPSGPPSGDAPSRGERWAVDGGPWAWRAALGLAALYGVTWLWAR